MGEAEGNNQTKLQEELEALQKQNANLRSCYEAMVAEHRAAVVERAGLEFDLKLLQQSEAERKEQRKQWNQLIGEIEMLEAQRLAVQAETSWIRQEYRELQAQHQQLLKSGEEAERRWEGRLQEVMERDRPFAEAWKTKMERLEEELCGLRKLQNERQGVTSTSDKRGEMVDTTKKAQDDRCQNDTLRITQSRANTSSTSIASPTPSQNANIRTASTRSNASTNTDRPTVKLLPIKGWLGGRHSRAPQRRDSFEFENDGQSREIFREQTIKEIRGIPMREFPMLDIHKSTNTYANRKASSRHNRKQAVSPPPSPDIVVLSSSDEE